jgi:sugar/nucleoside kinase (ribokinase family)
VTYDVAGLGNALMDALVVLDDDAIISELGLVRGTMHPYDHAGWQRVYEQVRTLGVVFDSGGSAANTCATVGRLGGRAIYCGQVGDDQMGQLYASLLERACGSHALRISSSDATGKCLSLISARDAERTMITDLGAAVRLPELGAYSGVLQRTRIAHFEGYTLLDGPMRQVVLEAMEVAHRAGARVSLDVSDPFVVVQVRDLLLTIAEQWLDVLFLNAEEARMLAPGLEAEDACAHIAATFGVRTVALKRGAVGSIVSNDGELIHVDAVRVHAIDTTGAGDAYAGGYLFGLARGWPAAQCGKLASAVAALAVAQIGAVVKDAEKLHAAVRSIEV